MLESYGYSQPPNHPRRRLGSTHNHSGNCATSCYLLRTSQVRNELSICYTTHRGAVKKNNGFDSHKCLVDACHELRDIEVDTVNVVIGTPIYRQGAYVIDKFLSNQKQIQQSYPSSELIMATPEYDFIKELESLVSFYRLRGTVLLYQIEKPDYAQSRIWDIACGREAIREYTLSQTKARYLLFLDADTIVEPSVIKIMEKEMYGYDVVFSGYSLRCYGTGLAGAGCVMLTRSILERFKFRCYEFKNGEVMFEDNILEMDLFRLGSRVKKGFFLSLSHYISAAEVKHTAPQPVGILRKIVNRPFVRYWLIRVSLMTHYNIPWRLKVFLGKFPVR